MSARPETAPDASEGTWTRIGGAPGTWGAAAPAAAAGDGLMAPWARE